MFSATQPAHFKSQSTVQEPPQTQHSGTLQHNQQSQAALVHQGRGWCIRRLTRQNLLPEHCGSAISVTQSQRLPSSLHHVTCCEAFHGSTARELPFGGPSPRALLQSAATPMSFPHLCLNRSRNPALLLLPSANSALPSSVWHWLPGFTGNDSCHLSEHHQSHLHKKVFM